ncbi:hypothetical protein GCM10023165_18910 [Variovorax defluvii]|uniref:Uncharacterized protein n=1 Tax=Variovorax defluvii TaxID=913761 RepID=A0ABP8HHP1_9BURK
MLPKREKTASTKSRPKVRSPREVIRDLRFGKQAKAAGAIEKIEPQTFIEIKKSNLQVIRENLPKGAVLDEETGYLSGGSRTESESTEFTGLFGSKVKNVGEFALNSLAYQLLKSVRPKIAGTDSAPANCDITSSAAGDFARHVIKFYDDQGEIFSARESGETEKERVFHTTNALLDFTGSEKSAFVLSAVLTQNTPTVFHRSLVNSTDIEVEGFRMVSAMNSKSVTKSFTKNDGTIEKFNVIKENDDGTFEELNKIRGLGAAEFRVSKVGRDFEVSMHWPCYYEAQIGKEEILPLGENEIIAIYTNVTFIIDGEKAEKGVLAFEIPNGINRTYEGRLRLN